MRGLLCLLAVGVGVAAVCFVLSRVLEGIKVGGVDKQRGLNVAITLPLFERARVLLSVPVRLPDGTPVELRVTDSRGGSIISEKIFLSEKIEQFVSWNDTRTLYILAELTDAGKNKFSAGQTYYFHVDGEELSLHDADIWILYGHNYGQSLLNEIRRQIKLREHPNAQVP